MKILAIDSTTKFLSIGISDGKKDYEYNVEVGRNLSALITLSLQRIVETLRWTLSDIDYFGCGLGPGSFTGMRIGLSTIKGLAWSLDKPIAGFSTLDVLAQAAYGALRAEPCTILPVIDAKRKLIYTALYQASKGVVKRLTPYKLISLKELAPMVRPGTVLCGDAIFEHKETLMKKFGRVTLCEQEFCYPQGRHIVAVAKKLIAKHKVTDALRVQPMYLYPKECQIKNYHEKL